MSSKRVPRHLSSAQALWADFNLAAQFPRPRKGRKAEGLRYEKKVNDFLEGKYSSFIPNLPFEYYDRTGKHLCIPDGILFTHQGVIVFEVKLTHTIKAYWELSTLYRPVIRLALRVPVRVAEITRSYDPSAPFPGAQKPFQSVDAFLHSNASEGVILWRPPV